MTEEVAKLEEIRFQEIRKFVKRIFETWLEDSQLPSINKLAEALTNYGLSQGELTTAIRQYQAEQRASEAKNATKGRIVALFGVAIICLLATLLWWRIGQVSATEFSKVETAAVIQARQIEATRLEANLQAKQDALAKLETKITGAQDQMTAIARTIQALSGTQQAAQEQAMNLQRLNQQFQFRLLQMDGQGGPQVVIQLQPDEQPISVDGKRYIVVSQPPTQSAQ